MPGPSSILSSGGLIAAVFEVVGGNTRPEVLCVAAAMIGLPSMFSEELKEKTIAQQKVKMEAYSALTAKGLPVPAACLAEPSPYDKLRIEYLNSEMDSVEFLLRADKLPLADE